MTPGERVDRALTLVNQAGSPLGHMITRRMISRAMVANAVSKLEEALRLLREVT